MIIAKQHSSKKKKPTKLTNIPEFNEFSDVANRLREVIDGDMKENKTWWSLQRLKEQGFKFGDGAKMSTRRAATSFKTQSVMGLLTIKTLREVLRRGWPGCYIP